MRIMRYFTLMLLVGLTISTSACRSPLPHYPWKGKDAAVTTILSHGRLETFSSACRLTLLSTDKSRIRLDGAIAAQPPDHFRIQTWKFGRNAFDLIITPNHRWIVASDKLKDQETSDVPDFEALLAWLNLDQLLDQSNHVVSETSTTMTLGPAPVASGVLQAQQGTYIVINKATRTCRRLYSIDDSGEITESVILSDWTVLANRPWPLRITANAASGQIDLRLHDVVLNESLPAAAFKPPRQAVEIR